MKTKANTWNLGFFSIGFIFIGVFTYGCIVDTPNNRARERVSGQKPDPDSSDGNGSNGSVGKNYGNKIMLPIEVLGQSGTSKEVKVDIPNKSGITHLYLRCNACGYDDRAHNRDSSKVKVKVRINGNSSIDIKHYTGGGKLVGNPKIKIMAADKGYGDIGGALRTIRFTVPINGLVNGRNTITFEHAELAAPSIGFRIIALNFLKGESLSSKVLSDSAFVDDNPANWKAPLPGVSDVRAGKSLWEKRDFLYDIGLDMIDGTGNRGGRLDGIMSASCSDCHAKDGRDLKYFNFSNYSIIERSVFHGTTKKEGEQIASYIRSLDQSLVEQARPWNPPYQPGPGLDSRPAYEWAAGAGLKWVLNSDKDMERHLLPKGTRLGEVRKVVDRYGNLNVRELPISIPLPEWNLWLPLIHPDDAFDLNKDAITSDIKGKNVGKPYYTALYKAAAANPTARNIGAMLKNIKIWIDNGADCYSKGNKNSFKTRALNGKVLSSLKIPRSDLSGGNCSNFDKREHVENVELAKRGLFAWLSVKTWEIIHTQNLEEVSQKKSKSVWSGNRSVDASELRGWDVDDRNLFERVSHFLSHNNKNFMTQDLITGLWETSAWYHLNMIVSPGYRQTMPSHFVYTISFLRQLNDETPRSQSFRFWASIIKMRQLQTNGFYGREAGLDLRTAQPFFYYSDEKGNTGLRSDVGKDLWRNLAQALVEDFVGDAKNATWKDWSSAINNSKVQPRDSNDFTLAGNSSRPFEKGEIQGRNTYRVIPMLRKIGVAESVLEDLINWGRDTWPKGRWDKVR